MSDNPYIRFYPSDFLAGTSGLSPAERGIYITLLCLMFEADGPIEWNNGRLARRCGAGNAGFKRALDALISEGKIQAKDGLLFNKRAQNAILQRNIASQNARAAAESRWTAGPEKTVQNQGPADAGASVSHGGSHASGICPPESINQKPETKGESTDSPMGAGVDPFEIFWDLAPRKSAKGAARKAFNEALRQTTPDVLISGMRAYAKSRSGQPERFTKFPVNWLRDGCWQDEASNDGDAFHSRVDQMLGGPDGLSKSN